MSAASRSGRLAALALGAAVCLSGLNMEDVPFEVLKGRPRRQSEQARYEVEKQDGALIVTIHAGRKPTGGYHVEVRRVEREGDRCVAHYAVIEPPPDALVPQVITYPAVTIRIRAACGTVEVKPPLPRGAPGGGDR